jgi:hypothetical protein
MYQIAVRQTTGSIMPSGSDLAARSRLRTAVASVCGLSSELHREREEQVRAYFDEHGGWLDDGADSPLSTTGAALRPELHRHAGKDGPRRIVPYPCLEGFGGEPTTEVITLGEVALESVKCAQGLFEFDAFGYDLEIESMREVDGGADDRCAAFVGGDARHERPVDLQLVDWKVTEVGQR